MRVRGLKLSWPRQRRMHWMSHPMRVRGLKLNGFIRHFLCNRSLDSRFCLHRSCFRSVRYPLLSGICERPDSGVRRLGVSVIAVFIYDRVRSVILRNDARNNRLSVDCGRTSNLAVIIVVACPCSRTCRESTTLEWNSSVWKDIPERLSKVTRFRGSYFCRKSSWFYGNLPKMRIFARILKGLYHV